MSVRLLYKLKSVMEVGQRQAKPDQEPVTYYQASFERSNELGETDQLANLTMSLVENEVGNWKVGRLYDFTAITEVVQLKRKVPEDGGSTAPA